MWSNAIGLEMESTGVAAAVYAASAGINSPRIAVFKAVSDRADVEKDDRWQAYASAVAATYLAKVVEQLEPKATPAGPAAHLSFLEVRLRAQGQVNPVDLDRSLMLQLEPLLSAYMNLNELQQLAFRTGLEWEELAGDVRSVKVINLLTTASRHRKLAKLVDELRERRPGLVDDLA